MSRIVKCDGYWEHRDGQGNNTLIERDDRGYFVPGFYGEGEPRFGYLSDVEDFINIVQSATKLPDDWRAWPFVSFFQGLT